ncbi:MAG: hypothetical protein U5K37_03440 [Natrialbaceae archaeon]|nr:hypothetical protein [Natrialbaceae archaeon]
MTTVTVSVGARVHIGFRNLSLDRERLYGGIGVGLETPSLSVTARPAETSMLASDATSDYAERACECLGVDEPGSD